MVNQCFHDDGKITLISLLFPYNFATCNISNTPLALCGHCCLLVLNCLLVLMKLILYFYNAASATSFLTITLYRKQVETKQYITCGIKMALHLCNTYVSISYSKYKSFSTDH